MSFAPREDTLSASAQVALKPRLLTRKHGDTHLQQVHERLVNWAAWCRMRLPGEIRHGHLLMANPDEADALLLDGILAQMKRWRPEHWRAIKCAYRRGWTDVACADEFGCSVRSWKDKLNRTLEWIHAILLERSEL